jgi:hypothetical protein
MKIFKSLILLTLFMLLTSWSASAGVSFSVQAPRQVVQGNKFNITFVLRNAEGEGFRAPQVGGSQLIYGPATSTSYSSQWINGVSSSSSSEEYTMTYKAIKPGRYTVGGAVIEAKGHRLVTNPITIEIVSSSRAASSSQQSQSVQIDNLDTQSSSSPVKSHDLFVRITLSKPRVYEQEAVVCTIKLYTKYQISQFMPTLQSSFNGFLIEDLPMQPSLNKIERVGGENYMVAVLKRCILFPQQSGKLTITSGDYDVTAVQYDTFRSMFGVIRQPVEKKLHVKSNSATVYITPLPNPKPATFNGAVGSFRVATSIKPQHLKTYETAALTYVISGTGNIKYLKTPTINFPSQFDVYDPQSTVKAGPVGGTVAGTTTINYTFIPQFTGNFDIPGTVFTYFNPETGKYVTLTTPKYNVNVAKGKGSPSAHYKKGLEQKNTDILHIKTGDLNLSKTHSYFITEFSYWLFYIIPLIAFIALLIYYRKTLKERSNLKLMKTKRANKIAKKRLKSARQYLNAHDSSKFYAEMLTALWGYLSDKLGIPVSALNKENIESELTKFGADQETTALVLSILDKCEFAQYAPASSDADMGEVLNSATDIMDKLENTKRK